MVNPTGQNTLDRRRDMDLIEWPGKGEATHAVDQDTVVKQRPDHFLHEKGRALCFLQDELFEGLERSGRNRPICFVKKRGQELFGIFQTQRVKSELAVVGLTSPLVSVFRSVVDQQQHRRGGQALTQAIEKGLRAFVQPLQVLKNQHYRLSETLTHKESFNNIEGALLADVGVHLLKRRSEFHMAQEAQQIGQSVFEFTLKRHHPPGDFFMQRPFVVMRANTEVIPQ